MDFEAFPSPPDLETITPYTPPEIQYVRVNGVLLMGKTKTVYELLGKARWPMTLKEISDRTGLAVVRVDQIVDSLVQESIVERSVVKQLGARGRPPFAFALAPDLTVDA